MKAVILDTVGHIVSVAHIDMVLGGVQHVGDPRPLEVGEVTDCLPVTDDDPSADLVARLFEIRGILQFLLFLD